MTLAQESLFFNIFSHFHQSLVSFAGIIGDKVLGGNYDFFRCSNANTIPNSSTVHTAIFK